MKMEVKINLEKIMELWYESEGFFSGGKNNRKQQELYEGALENLMRLFCYHHEELDDGDFSRIMRFFNKINIGGTDLIEETGVMERFRPMKYKENPEKWKPLERIYRTFRGNKSHIFSPRHLIKGKEEAQKFVNEMNNRIKTHHPKSEFRWSFKPASYTDDYFNKIYNSTKELIKDCPMSIEPKTKEDADNSRWEY